MLYSSQKNNKKKTQKNTAFKVIILEFTVIITIVIISFFKA